MLYNVEHIRVGQLFYTVDSSNSIHFYRIDYLLAFDEFINDSNRAKFTKVNSCHIATHVYNKENNICFSKDKIQVVNDN